MEWPPLRSLHAEETLSPAKLLQLRTLSTDQLMNSLLPGRNECLKARPDGTILDGHHRLCVLRERGVNIDALPRELHEQEGLAT